MAGLGTRKSGVAQRALKSKGFGPKTGSGTHHEYLYLHLDGKVTEIFTYFSHRNSGDDLRGNEISGMKRQLKFETPCELFDFIDCRISETEYISLLRERGHLPPEEKSENAD